MHQRLPSSLSAAIFLAVSIFFDEFEIWEPMFL